MTERILCAVDLSDCSHAALTQALFLAKTLNARLDVVHACYVPQSIAPDMLVWERAGSRPIWKVAEEHARSELDGFLERHGADIQQRVDLHVLVRDPTSAILDLARQQASTLIVLGTHGRTGVARWVTGSVAARVVRLAPCAVLTVRGAERKSSQSLRRILIGVDFSECSLVALRRAAELARALDAELDVVHVWQIPAFVSPDAMVGRSAHQLEGLARVVEREAARSLAKLVDEARKGGIWVERARLLSGEPAQTVVSQAEQGNYDLIALGTHGHTGFRRALLGSVAERVVRRASQPVLTVREELSRARSSSEPHHVVT